MSIDVKMPKLSDSMEEGTIVRWLKGPGDEVEAGEPLAEVETDKADVELEASDSGRLSEILVNEGQSAGVGDVIARLSEAGEAGDGGSSEAATRGGIAPTTADPPERSQEAAEPEGTEGERPAPATRREEQRAQPAASDEEAAAHAGKAGAAKARSVDRRPASVRASPLAWRLAEERRVDLTTIDGSGPGGRILRRDVEAATRPAAPQAPPAPDGPRSREAPRPSREETKPPPSETTHVERLSRMRKAIARRMSDAKRDIPHFYVGAEIDVSEAVHLRESIKRSGAIPRLTVTHLLVKALAMALERHPRVNASWQEDGVQFHDDVNVGIAVAVDDGLVVPVVHRVQQLTLDEVTRRAAALVERAREGKFGGDDLSGATISISNVGMFDVDELVAVINPPHAAILAVAAIRERPVARGGQLAVAKTMHATLSCDHRVLDGVEGARFLAELKSILENPVILILE